MATSAQQTAPQRRTDAKARAPVSRQTLAKWAASQLRTHGYDDRDPSTFRSIVTWLVETATGKGPGLYLHGVTGSGKTHALRILARMMTADVLRARDMVAMYADSPPALDEWLHWRAARPLAIDDLGTEQEGAHFGQRLNVLAHVIDRRDRQWRANPRAMTLFSANLSTRDDVLSRYDDRTYSRLRGMCAWVRTGDRDWRVNTQEACE